MTKPKTSAAKASLPAARTVASQADIHQSIYDAIVEHRLLPGTKLSEERVAELFAVSRTQVRGALQRLAVEQLVTLIPNRGAFVTTPSAEEAHDVLSVRRTLEPAAVARLIERIEAGKAPAAVKQFARAGQARAAGPCARRPPPGGAPFRRVPCIACAGLGQHHPRAADARTDAPHLPGHPSPSMRRQRSRAPTTSTRC